MLLRDTLEAVFVQAVQHAARGIACACRGITTRSHSPVPTILHTVLHAIYHLLYMIFNRYTMYTTCCKPYAVYNTQNYNIG